MLLLGREGGCVGGAGGTKHHLSAVIIIIISLNNYHSLLCVYYLDNIKTAFHYHSSFIQILFPFVVDFFYCCRCYYSTQKRKFQLWFKVPPISFLLAPLKEEGILEMILRPT